MKVKKWRIFLGILVLLGAMSCEDQITNQVEMPAEITTATREQQFCEAGWNEFKKGDFNAAEEQFLAAIDANSYYADAYNGLGWVYSKLDSLELSKIYFTIGRISATTEDLFRDASAGRAFVNLAIDQYPEAVSDANDALRWDYYYTYYAEYVFRHDLSITETDLFLVRAESLFLMEEYQDCYQSLMIIDETLDIDPSDPEGLALAIEYLKGIV
jgi:tetratricopeptide (TPR) repeat protein